MNIPIMLRLQLIVAITAVGALAIEAMQTNCTYSVEIETTCASTAGTKDIIDVRFSDKVGNVLVAKHLQNPKPELGMGNGGSFVSGFERCAINMFEVSGTCMSERVCALYVKKFGSDGWRPGWVKVFYKGGDGNVGLVSYVFYFRTFVPQNVWFGLDYCGSSRGFKVPQVANFDSST